ncbi:MAG: hypothetical protein WC455_13885 [Dehalococcoidia bacterium]
MIATIPHTTEEILEMTTQCTTSAMRPTVSVDSDGQYSVGTPRDSARLQTSVSSRPSAKASEGNKSFFGISRAGSQEVAPRITWGSGAMVDAIMHPARGGQKMATSVIAPEEKSETSPRGDDSTDINIASRRCINQRAMARHCFAGSNPVSPNPGRCPACESPERAGAKP